MRKILIVDDDNVTRTILKTVLESEYEVMEATNGQAALEFAAKADLIICDFHMPVMDGMEFAKTIKEQEIVKKFIPFIMLTVENDPKEKEKSKALGVTAWVTKPFAPNIIIAKVKQILM